MKSNFKRIGNYIKLVDERNSDLKIDRLLGINITKNYMPSVANTSGVDLSRYKIVKKDRFACNIMHVGRDEKLPIALYAEDEPAIVSPAYMTFEVINTEELLPEYLMMVFQRAEFDRFTWFVSDSSVRGGLEWERFCEIEIPIPDDIEEQKRFVAIYKELLINQQSYDKSLKDLEFVCLHSIELIKTKVKSKRIGSLIRLVETRNLDLSITKPLGINISKNFMPTIANVTLTDLSKYKVIKRGQFAYSAMQVGRDETIRVALYNDNTPAIISPAYLVFEVIDTNEILVEFLMIWFQRAETDRYGWFISDGSVRASLEWDRFCEIEIPVPDNDVQAMIVTMYHVLKRRQKINEKLKRLVEPLCPILIKGVVNQLN